MVTRDVHVYANTLFFPFLFFHTWKEGKVVCGSGSVSLGRIPCIEPFPSTGLSASISFVFVSGMGGSLVFVLLIRGSAEKSRNWSIAVICGEEISRQSRRRWDGRDGREEKREMRTERTSDFSR